ncbi:hypothetical protein ACFHW0_10240 [Micromonospora sp. LOL_025]|uniref:hypothetical protein n=1 Tax=Micromonospora sp. LOL_025 TaxID=3345413 RepID=UPI003A8AD7D5
MADIVGPSLGHHVVGRPVSGHLWENGRAGFVSLLAFDAEIRPGELPTKPLVSVSAGIRRAVRACGYLPNEQPSSTG